MSFTIQSTPKYSYIRKPVQFGKSVYRNLQMESPKGHLQAQNIVQVFTERIPVKDGGLGEVAKTTTEAQAEFMPEKDVRVVVPYQKAHRDKDLEDPAHAFKDTGVVIPDHDKYGRPVNLKVLQKFEYATGFDDTVDVFTDPKTGNKVEKKIGNWVYALRADEYFIGKNAKNEETGLYKYTYNPDVSDFDKLMMYNRAAAKLLPMLEGNFKGAPSLEKFHNTLKKQNQVPPKVQTAEEERNYAVNNNPESIDVVVAHDWLSGSTFNELPGRDTTKKIFMVHNKYDGINTPEAAMKAGLHIPERLNNREENFSALQNGLETADGTIVNRNFANTLLNTQLAGGQHFVQVLKRKIREERAFNMHHGLSRDITANDVKDTETGKVTIPAAPSLNENFQSWKVAMEKSKVGKSSEDIDKIQKKIDAVVENLAKGNRLNLPNNEAPYQFEPLKTKASNGVPNEDEMKKFKAHNKKTLQLKWGLPVDENAVMIGWAARLEPRQKGFFLVQKSIDNILKAQKDIAKAGGKPKNVQFVMLGNTDDPHIKRWIKQINKDYPGHLYIPNAFANKEEVIQLNSASDFTVLPSIYEPYGLTQLEAMKMGSIPIVHGVDGLRTTVNDPEIVENVFKKQPNWRDHEEAVWTKPQNGFLMAPMDIDEYARYTDQRMDKESLETAYDVIGAAQNSIADLNKKLKDIPLSDAKKRQPLDEAIKKNNDKISGNMTAFIKVLNGAVGNRKYYAEQALEQGKQEEAAQLQQKANAIASLKQRIERQRHITEQDMADVKRVMAPDDSINERESAKLTEAMNRAIGQTPDAATRIRIDALHYVNTEHAWSKLIDTYYKPVFENSFLDAPARARHKAEWAAAQKANEPPKPEPVVEYVKTRQKSTNAASGFSGTTAYYWNYFLELHQQFWAAIGRLFAVRKD